MFKNKVESVSKRIDKLKVKHQIDIINTKQKIIDDLLIEYPFLEEYKKDIYMKFLNKESPEIKKTKEKEIILDQFKYKDKIYYKDDNNSIWDDKANLIGVIRKYKNNIPQCDFFNEKQIDNIKNFDLV
ncbi:MAG: hypothetical protein CMF62_02565 [Magnetococcales bacterium]|nr:hypothetical protein [Magnetococcales bacterium]|tara:strand:+ start:78014 stop:78397 length:384 start_codon:yes stop_codon:yes gene_type:complete